MLLRVVFVAPYLQKAPRKQGDQFLLDIVILLFHYKQLKIESCPQVKEKLKQTLDLCMKSIYIALDAAGVSFEKTKDFVCNTKFKVP